MSAAKMKAKRSFELRGKGWVTIGRCFYCNGTLDCNVEQNALGHSVPACNLFKGKDPLDFLRDMRMDRELEETMKRARLTQKSWKN
jgi:hypothetical protein